MASAEADWRTWAQRAAALARWVLGSLPLLRVGVLDRTSGGWSLRSGPAGDLVAAAEVGGRVYLATHTSPDQTELWSGEAG